MSIKKFSMMLLSAMSMAALISGCGSSSKEGSNNVGGVAKVDEATCRVCHSTTIDPVSKTGIIQDFIGTAATATTPATPASIHFQLPDGNPNADAGCQGCHGGGAQHNGVGPIPFSNPIAEGRCNAAECHNNKVPAGLTSAAFALQCSGCHGTGSIHGIQFKDPAFYNDCIGCHAIGQTHATANVVKDNNNGVRAITAEFTKWSHHVTGVNLQNAHCAACHLEGKAEGGKIVVDRTYHMADNKTHLRNADTDADMQWNPAAPNHSTMDNFCMSCHDADGATSAKSAAIRALMVPAAGKTASASNPFGDTISNRYDKMQRPAVVDASSQFNTTNNSHHAVKGPRYSGRTRAAGPRQIASPATFAQNSSATLQGVRSTIYDAGNLNQLYTPLENAGGEAFPRTGSATLGDDSTLHCGDCHTVGQWTVGSSTTANGSDTTAVIGAHGSNNEYLLRNSIGTDERHTQNAFTVTAGIVTYTNPGGAFLVCYNCHNYNKYGSIFLATGVVGGHVGEYDAAGRCNGIGNTLPFNGYTTGTATDGSQFVSRFDGPISRYGTNPAFAPGFPLNGTAPVGEQNPDFGNIYGIQCNNCHNSGINNAYGGIHGSKVNTYIDGMGNTQKVERFLPGLGNAMHVPGTLGGITGGTTATFIRYSTSADRLTATPLPVRDNLTSTKLGSYNYTTGGVSNDTNWEQKHWQQTPTTFISASGTVTKATAQGAGCYTLGGDTTVVGQPTRPAAASALRGPSVTGAGGPATTMFGTWGGCDDHNAPQGGGDHGFIKKIVRPVTY